MSYQPTCPKCKSHRVVARLGGEGACLGCGYKSRGGRGIEFHPDEYGEVVRRLFG